MARRSSSSSSSSCRQYLHSAYYIRRLMRLAFVFVIFILPNSGKNDCMIIWHPWGDLVHHHHDGVGRPDGCSGAGESYVTAAVSAPLFMGKPKNAQQQRRRRRRGRKRDVPSVRVRGGEEGAGDPHGAGELPLLRRRRDGDGRGEVAAALLPPRVPQDYDEVLLHPLFPAPRHLSLMDCSSALVSRSHLSSANRSFSSTPSLKSHLFVEIFDSAFDAISAFLSVSVEWGCVSMFVLVKRYLFFFLFGGEHQCLLNSLTVLTTSACS
ncbi:hypothetical protein MUK42_08073 [Musa troglodytarum]|uniref:Uncharacterized protein n=1 Tax=Musa troglodytarum TaxID=320322 RepID=A0A9E7L365_9LILI|nr:hypothetical protein MUK42_08073 [Musa troglodytarum]